MPDLAPLGSPASVTRRPAARWAVAGVTFGMTAACVWYALRFGSNAPVVDEWDLAPELAQAVADGRWGEWVVGRHNEHFFVPGRALYAALMAGSGFHFQAGMVASALLLGAAAWVFAAAARRARGRSGWADVVIPALVLHFGHGYNLLMGYQVVFSLFVLSAAVFTWAVAADRGTRAWDVVVAAAVLALPPGGGMGLAFGAPAVGWLLVRARARRRAGESPRWLAFTAVLPAALAAGYAAWSVTGAPRTGPAGQGFGWAFPAAAGQFVAMAVGPWVIGPKWWVAALAVGTVYAVVGCRLAVVVTRAPAERIRALGLLAAVVGVFVMAAGVAWGRGGGLVDRYANLSAVGLCAAVVAAARYGPAVPRPLAAGLGLAAAAAVVAANSGPGMAFGAAQRTYYREMEAGIADGEPPAFVADGFAGVLFPYGRFRDRVDWLRRERLGVFRNMAADGPVAVAPAEPLGPATLPYCDAHILSTAPPAVPYAAPGRRVLGLRAEIELDAEPDWLQFRLRWTGADGRDRVAVTYPRMRAGRQTVSFWVNDDPMDVRFAPGSATLGVVVRRAEWVSAAP